MRSVGVNTNIPATKGLAELNHHSRNELKGVRNGVGLDGHGLSEEDESRINELVQPHGAPRRPHQQPQGPVVQWERFLPLRSLKVLLVENDDSTRHVVSALLRNCSYEVTAVSNGLEAWKVLIDLNKQIDLVLTEVIMPYLSGTYLLSKITNHMTRKNTPVIMMSSDDSMGIVFNCLSKGAVDFLVKPIRKNELKNLWQHVWRKCHSSSSSGSESGIRAHKSAKSRDNEGSDEDNDISDEDDNTSIGLNAKGGSDNGSGTQNSWPKRVVEVNSSQAKSLWDKLPNSRNNTCPDVARPETSKNYWPTWAATRDHVIENNNNNNNKLEVVEMGKDLEIGMPKSSSFEMQTVNKKVTEKLRESNGDKLDIGRLHLGCENSAPRTETAKTSDAHMEAIPKAHDLIKNINNKDKSIYYNKAINKESPALELSLKRPRDMEDVKAGGQERNVLRHSDLSPFSRYNTISNPNQAPTGNVGSCSPLGISSEAAKPDNIRSNSNRTPNQQSNGSNDMGSTTNNAFTKPDATTDSKTRPNGSTTAVHHTHTTTPLHPLVPCALDHYHTHHPHVHKQQKANGDDESMRNMVSNMLTASAEGSAANYGSVSGSNGENCSSENGKIAGDNGVAGKCVARDGSGSGSGMGSGVDQERSAQREAALNKFRQKRKERCFEKKVRYQSRKRLAEQRPRVRGQFVRHGTNGINNEDADS